uniref:Uncharacterized protein n=1 Tax=Rhizophora mucronata TaxID=61149 RepID=A0A2P2IIG7_RHIMU
MFASWELWRCTLESRDYGLCRKKTICMHCNFSDGRIIDDHTIRLNGVKVPHYHFIT